MIKEPQYLPLSMNTISTNVHNLFVVGIHIFQTLQKHD